MYTTSTKDILVYNRMYCVYDLILCPGTYPALNHSLNPALHALNPRTCTVLKCNAFVYQEIYLCVHTRIYWQILIRARTY